MSVGGIVVDVPFRGRRAARPGSLTAIFKKSEFLGNRQNRKSGRGRGAQVKHLTFGGVNLGHKSRAARPGSLTECGGKMST